MPGIVSENPQYGEPEIRPISVSPRSWELPKPPHKSRLGQFFLVSTKVEHSVLCYDQKVGNRGEPAYATRGNSWIQCIALRCGSAVSLRSD
jgi:hypothetical protein